jgi:glycosyltransferase involved in cell wall biosynthesis
VVQPLRHSPWGLRWLSRGVFRRSAFRGTVPYFRAFGPELLRKAPAAPLAVWDWDDQPFIYRHNLFLLDRATLYFKRELPPDHWRLFMGALHDGLPPERLRLKEKHRARLAKVRPISLGLLLGSSHTPMTPPAREKSIDVLFVGRTQATSTVRTRGLHELQALQSSGVQVDLPDGHLSLADYLDRCARARLVWSPEGHGHESFRTYEAAACGAVPVINRPTIERYRPLREGEHCLYYDVEPGGLTRTIETALRDRDRLAAMGAAAREFVLAHHTAAALARYVAEATLAAVGKG